MSQRAVRRTVPLGLAAAVACGAMTWSHAPSAGPPLPGRLRDPVMRPLSTTATSSMGTVRWLHVAAQLADGRVLVAGGRPGDATQSAEIYDPSTGAWTPTTPMLYPHDWPVGAALCDGRVFVAGRNSGSAPEAEIYDPATDTWVAAGNMKYSHLYGVATLLPDCRLLLSGGYSANTHAEIFDPSQGTYKNIGAMSNERFFHSATVLADGIHVLVAGGGVDVNGQWFTYPSADILDTTTGKWSKAKKMHHDRRAHTATLLPDGRVLVAGGTTGGKNDGTQGGTQLATSEIYDPFTNLWDAPVQLITPRTFHTAALVPSGAVLLFGGLDATGSASSLVEGYFDGVWQALDPLVIDRHQHASALLAGGRVLLSGGVHQATAEIYDLAQLGDACPSNVVCGSGHCVGGVCCDEACTTGCRQCNVPGKEGTCSLPCKDDTHAWACSDGSATCPNDTCAEQLCDGELRCGADKGACLNECTTVEDCAPGYACDMGGECVPPPDVSSTDAEGCSVGPPGEPGDGVSGAPGMWAVWTVIAAAGLARRRRTEAQAGS
jgi:hypothetical protein